MSQLNITSGEWYVDTTTGLNVIKSRPETDNDIPLSLYTANAEDRQIAIVEEFHDAAILATAKKMLDALAELSVIVGEMEDGDQKDRMMELISEPLEKLVTEVS